MSEALDAVKKSVADLVTLVKTGQEGQEATFKGIIETALKNHPGVTTQRKFSAPMNEYGKRVEDLMHKMPGEIKSKMDDCYIASKILRIPVKNLKSWGDLCREGSEFKKALDTAAAAGGGDWVPTEFSSQLAEEVRLQLRVAALFPEIRMPSNPYKLPVQIGKLSTFKQPEQTADTGQTKIPVGDAGDLTGNATLTAVGHASRVLASKEVQEDSIIAIMPFLRAEIAKAIADGREECILNGDTAGTHEDSDVTSADDRRKMWLGLRAHANDQSYKTDLSTLSVTNLRSLRGSMVKYGIMPSQLCWIVSMNTYIKLLGLSALETLDKYGPAATILTGELAKLDGIPVLVSEHVRSDLNASGVQDGVTTNKSVLHAVYKPGFVIGNRRQITTQLLSELYAESDQDALITKERIVFQALYPIASNKTTWMGFNITT